MDIVTPMGPKTKVALKNARTKKVQSTPLDKKWMITTVRRHVPLVIRVWVPFHVFPFLKYVEFFIIMTENGNKKWWKIKIVNKLLKISRFCCLWKISRHGSLDHTFVFGFFSFFLIQGLIFCTFFVCPLGTLLETLGHVVRWSVSSKNFAPSL